METQINSLGQHTGVDLDNWQPRAYPGSDPMMGRYCRLVALCPETHAQQLFEAFSDDTEQRNWTYLPYGPFDTLESFKGWLVESSQSSDPLFYTIIDQRSDQAVGLASYLRIEPTVGAIEVGHIHFSPRLQKTPLATEAMYLMMHRAFAELGYRRYEWKCDACNQGSRNAAQRLGFQYEGIFRQATLYKGRNRDTAWFSIIDKEWPTLQVMFERWLDESNFDHNGQQINSLLACLKEYAA